MDSPGSLVPGRLNLGGTVDIENGALLSLCYFISGISRYPREDGQLRSQSHSSATLGGHSVFSKAPGAGWELLFEGSASGSCLR